jgi:hypothetical protein
MPNSTGEVHAAGDHEKQDRNGDADAQCDLQRGVRALHNLLEVVFEFLRRLEGGGCYDTVFVSLLALL